MTFRAVIMGSSLAAFCATGAMAQGINYDGIGAEAGISTLGVYVAPDYAVNEQIHVRAPIYLAGIDRTFDLDGNDVDGSLDVSAFSIVADYYVMQSGFRVSGGIAVGGYEFSGTTSNPTLDGVSYTGDFTAKLEQDDNVAPVLAIGYQRTLSRGFGIATELGVRVTSMTLTTTGQESLDAGQQATFDASIADINNDLNDYGVIPFASLGVSYRF